jgi:hypothetical protein
MSFDFIDNTSVTTTTTPVPEFYTLPPVLQAIIYGGIPAYLFVFVTVTYVMWRKYLQVGRQRNFGNTKMLPLF